MRRERFEELIQKHLSDKTTKEEMKELLDVLLKGYNRMLEIWR